MTEAVQVSRSSSTATLVISGKEPGSKRTYLEELLLTARSPMGWVLLVSLVLTWSCVIIVLFDLLDYKTLAGMAPPPLAVRKVMKAASRSRGALQQATSDTLKAASDETPRESTDWLSLLLTFASNLVAPEDEEVEEIFDEIPTEEL